MDAQQIRGLKPTLMEYLARYDHCFCRRDTRQHLPVYIEGQLSDLPQKSVEPIALKAGVAPRTLQQFLATHCWDEDCMRRCLQQMVATEHASPRSIGIIDETSDVKKGVMTPGVQRQYCGTVGKRANCIVTVHLGYAADDFHCLVDGELFLPEIWSSDRERCRKAGIPDTMVYRSKTVIALELYDRAKAHGLHFEWLTFDEWYGSKPPFLRALDQRGQMFVGEVNRKFTAWTRSPRVTTRPFHRCRRGTGRRTPRVITGSPKPLSVEAMLRRYRPLREQAWKRYRVKDGEKGPLVWEVKHMPIYPKDEDALPAEPYHLLVARNVLNPIEIKYFVSNAAPGTSVEKMLLVAFSRWRIERCFEDEKGEIGLDQYEGRWYQGLKRHLILSAVSHLFLVRVHQALRGEKPGVDGLPSAHGSGGCREELGPFFRTSQRAFVPANGERTSLDPSTPYPSSQEPHQDYLPETACPGHSPNRPSPLQLELELAL
jgi:SRSO17 transposase